MKDLFKKINSLQMTEIEKQSGFSALKTFIDSHPVKVSLFKKIENNILSPFSNDMWLHHKILASTFAIILIVSATGGTSFVARNSLPGDTLYPIKINLNEKVETFTALTPESKAVVEASHIDERLSEIKQLSSQNKLDSENITKIENQFSQNLQNTMSIVNTLKSKGDVKGARQVKINIENSLQKHKSEVNEIFKNKNKKVEARMAETTITPKQPEARASISTFSATMATEDISTSTQKTTEKIELDTKEDDDTPLLNETLNKILESNDSDKD